MEKYVLSIYRWLVVALIFADRAFYFINVAQQDFITPLGCFLLLEEKKLVLYYEIQLDLQDHDKTFTLIRKGTVDPVNMLLQL